MQRDTSHQIVLDLSIAFENLRDSLDKCLAVRCRCRVVVLLFVCMSLNVLGFVCGRVMRMHAWRRVSFSRKSNASVCLALTDVFVFVFFSFDVDYMISYLAIHEFGNAVDDNLHNYYIYRRTSDLKWIMMPWDAGAPCRSAH